MFPGTSNATVDDGTVRDIAIVVPARNEQDHLGDCLTSLQNAAAHLRLRAPDIGCRVVVVLDDCTDNSATIVAERDDITGISVGFRNVGRARRAGAEAVISGATARAESVWLVSTDADCRVPTTWLMNFVSAAADCYHVVLGMVRPDTELSLPELHAWNRQHRCVEGHPHIHGANLGARADVYDMIGGWAAKPSGEDVDLVRRAETRTGVRILRTPRDAVITSTRRDGRAPAAFAAYLSALPTTG